MLKLFANSLKDKELIYDEKPIIKYELRKEIKEVEKHNGEFIEIKKKIPGI